MEPAAQAFLDVVRETSRLVRSRHPDVNLSYTRRSLMLGKEQLHVVVSYWHGDGPPRISWRRSGSTDSTIVQTATDANGDICFQQGSISMRPEQFAQELVNLVKAASA